MGSKSKLGNKVTTKKRNIPGKSIDCFIAKDTRSLEIHKEKIWDFTIISGVWIGKCVRMEIMRKLEYENRVEWSALWIRNNNIEGNLFYY